MIVKDGIASILWVQRLSPGANYSASAVDIFAARITIGEHIKSMTRLPDLKFRGGRTAASHLALNVLRVHLRCRDQAIPTGSELP